MENKKAQENLIVGVLIGLVILITILMLSVKPQEEELINCETEGVFIDYKCEDGRTGFITLKEWNEIHEGCYDYTYYHKCQGISKLITSDKINKTEKRR